MDDGLHRLEEYKKKIKHTYREYTSKSIQWVTATPGRQIQHFKCAKTGLYKMEALLKCNPERLFEMCADRHYVTRSQWDEHAREMCPYQKEHYETKDGHIYLLTGNVIQWVRPKKIVMFLNGSMRQCTWVKQVDEKAFLIIISNVKITLETTSYEVVARDLVRFNAIYRPWSCEFCRKNVPAHELYCRQCKKERYVRCSDLACYEPQLKGAQSCWKCKKEI